LAVEKSRQPQWENYHPQTALLVKTGHHVKGFGFGSAAGEAESWKAELNPGMLLPPSSCCIRGTTG